MAKVILFLMCLGLSVVAEEASLPVPREVSAPPVIATTTLAPAPKPAETNPAAILEALKAKRSQPAVSSHAGGDWAAYNRDRVVRVMLDGRLVDKHSLIPLIGFLARERTTITDNGKKYYGAALDLAERKPDAPKVAPAMEMRPSLWNRTHEQVFLLDYKPMSLPGALMKVYVVEVDSIDGWRTFKVGTEPSFEEWKRLR